VNAPAADFVLHRGPSLLLDEVLDADESHAVARVRITENSLYFDGVGVPPLIVLEYMAQTVGVFSGAIRRKLGESPRMGLLLGCRQMTLEAELLRVGDEICVEARHVWSALPLGQFDCRALRNGQVIATATLTVYEGTLENVLSA
jgi:predicted hotdog family 3-hydroxylacyl-ACP dehydratase